MSYNPATDFIGLLRLVGSGVRSERMPGLDYVVAALARAGLFALSVGQTAPTVNQATTFWFQPAIPSWTAEGTLYIWNPVAGQYQIATPALWQAFLSPSGSVFQSLAAANNVINSGASLAAVQRVAPANTAVQLPTIAAQYLTQKDIVLIDYSTGIVGQHEILVSPVGGATIMQQATWTLQSTPDYLARVRLRPSPDLNSWVLIP
jgi:phage tail protein X